MATEVNKGYDDAQANNESSRSTFIYKDLNLFFTKHPVTDDVSKLTDIQAIKRSVRTLILTNKGERLFHPEIGSNINSSLFELYTPIMQEELRLAISDVIRLYEPRVVLHEVIVNSATSQDLDQNRLRIIIKFSIQNVPNEIEELEIVMDRIR
jgi:phage baseplate assembly protein W|tara:strand:+ start:103 stop:561 length:459 start_codon:yes stop_codon:yes gene_type:complete